LCSESTGNNSAPDFAAARVINSPAITSVSLLATATVLPFSSAAHVPSNPAAPTMALTTTSTSGSVTILAMPSAPTST
jgi:hypothetical protein